MSGEAANEHRRRVETFVARQRFTFTSAETGRDAITIVENASRKSLVFSFQDVEHTEEAKDAKTGSSYLRVRLVDGRVFALTAFGFVFAPAFGSTGPLADCPEAASFTDYERLNAHLLHLLDDRHEGHEREALQVFVVLLAFLDGARAIGFDVSEEEKRLEGVLGRLEAMGLSAP